MIVTDAPQIVSSSIPEIDQGSSVAAPGAGEADFAALLFLILGAPQATNNPVAAGSGDTIEPSSALSLPAADQEAKLGEGDFSAGQASEMTEAGQQAPSEAPFPALQPFTEAIAETTPSALSLAGNTPTMPREISGLQLNAGLGVSDPATHSPEADDSSLTSGEEKAPAQTAAAKVIDMEPSVGAPSAETPDDNLTSAKQFRADAATVRDVDGNAASATPEPLSGEVKKNSEGAADASAKAVAGPQAVSHEASGARPGASARATIHGQSDDKPNQFGRLGADKERARADDNMARFNFSGKSQPEKAPGAEANAGDSGFILAPTKEYNVAETSAEAPRGPTDAPISTFTASQELSADRHSASAREWRPVIGRVANEIAGHLRVNQHEAIIQLDPPDLGKIKIDLHVQGDKLQAHIIAEAHESHALIENHLHELRQALQAQSLDVVDVRVSQGGLGGSGDPTAGFRQQFNGGEETAWSSANPAAAASERRDARRQDSAEPPSGRVSVWA